MESRNRFRVVDVAVGLGCLALVLMTLGAVGQTGRGRAKEVVCQANLNCWGGVFADIVAENDGTFLTGVTSSGYWWPMQLPEELQSWKKNRTWFCPAATIPQWNENGVSFGQGGVFEAWGIYYDNVAVYQGKTYSLGSDGIAGSYGLNGYTLAIRGMYEGGVPASRGWGNLRDAPDADRIPMFVDALRFDLWPQESQGPAASENAAWSANSMARCCINRHDGAVNCLFVDGSVRKVGLKELWTLKWHRLFNTEGPWTTAGGVGPEDWPEWMRPFKDY